MKRPTMMERAGLPASEARQIVEESRGPERLVALLYRGELRQPGDSIGDIDLPDGTIWGVKSVPSPRATFVNGGEHRPRVLQIVVSRVPALVLCAVPLPAWVYGRPEVPGLVPIACWYALREWTVDAPSAQRVVLGYDDPRWYEQSDDDLLHADWNERDRRRRERRSHGRPEPLWGEDFNPKGVGLASRRGHAPGKGNYRRARP